MNRRFVVAVTLAAVSVSSMKAVPLAFGAPLAMPGHAMIAKIKVVKFNLRNDSGARVKLRAGEQSMTLDAGKVMSVKLPEGTRITFEEATGKRSAGAVLAEVSRSLGGNTLVIN